MFITPHPPARPFLVEAAVGQGLIAGDLLIRGWGEGVRQLPLPKASRVSIQLVECKVEFTPRPAAHRPGPPTVPVGAGSTAA